MSVPLAAYPTVSFIIPVRDDAARLRGCLASIARNLYPPNLVRVIVVDNGSDDDSPRVATVAGAQVIRSAGRVGMLRNLGASRAATDLLAFVDADHEISANWIRAAVHTPEVQTHAAAHAEVDRAGRAETHTSGADVIHLHQHGVSPRGWMAVKRRPRGMSTFLHGSAVSSALTYLAPDARAGCDVTAASPPPRARFHGVQR